MDLLELLLLLFAICSVIDHRLLGALRLDIRVSGFAMDFERLLHFSAPLYRESTTTGVSGADTFYFIV